MSRRRARFAFLILFGLVSTGCGASTVTGRRVHGAQVVAHGAVPYQVGAYELVFAEPSGPARQARRAALLVDLVGGHGRVQGFAEWGRSGETPKTYVVGGWAQQRNVEGEPMTVFELALNHLEPREGRRAAPDPEAPTSLAVRVVVNEASGDVTLVRHR